MTITHYNLNLPARVVQFLVDTLGTRPINEAGDDHADLKAQIRAQEAAAAERERELVRAEILAAEPKPARRKARSA